MQPIQFVCEGKPLGDPLNVDYIPTEDYLITANGTNRELRQIRKIVHKTGKATEVHVSAPYPWFASPR
jgi:hypothetical protein